MTNSPESFAPASRNGVAVAPQAVPKVDRFDFDTFVGELLRAEPAGIYLKVCQEVERRLLIAALEHSKGSQVKASKLLGISRNTLRAKLRLLGLAVEKNVRSL